MVTDFDVPVLSVTVGIYRCVSHIFQIISLGIGDEVDHDELEAVASSTDNVFTVKNFRSLGVFEDRFKTVACQGKKKEYRK